MIVDDTNFRCERRGTPKGRVCRRQAWNDDDDVIYLCASDRQVNSYTKMELLISTR